MHGEGQNTTWDCTDSGVTRKPAWTTGTGSLRLSQIIPGTPEEIHDGEIRNGSLRRPNTREAERFPISDIEKCRPIAKIQNDFQYRKLAMHMNSNRRKRSPGRPRKGNKAYCVRLPPDAYAKVRRAAGEHGLSLSGWLQLMATVKDDPATDEYGEGDRAQAARQFEFFVRETRSLLKQIRELFDLDPSLARKPDVKVMLRDIHSVCTDVFDFMRSEGVLKT